MKKTLTEAAELYISRRDRMSHPSGSFDAGGRWYPDKNEKQDCCQGIRSPSRAHPYSYLVHCRTVGHVAQLCEVVETDLREEVRRLKPPAAPVRKGGRMFKTVAVTPDGRYISVFDGKTEYCIGVTMQEQARQHHNGGFYVYETIADAARAEFPDRSRAENLPRGILEVQAEGQYCRYDSGKLAFSRITPIAVHPWPLRTRPWLEIDD